MERTVSIEEKIKRAEKIYNKRKNPQTRIETETINNTTDSYIKKKFKKIFIQMSVCIIIYVILYTTDFGGTIFKQDTANYIKTFFTEDIDFQGFYKSVVEYIKSIIPNEESNNQNIVNTLEENESDLQNSVEDNLTNNGNIDITIDNQNQDEQSQNNNIGDNMFQSEESSTSNIETINCEDNIGGAIETEDVIEEDYAKQKSQMEIDSEYILSKVNFIKPIEVYQISSRYGIRNPTTASVPKNHTGIDLATEKGTKIVSATDGTVVLASSIGDYGNHLKIKIDDITIIYAHCNKLYVEEGEQIYQGQEIGEVGSTGNSTGPHLHFEIRVEDRVVDPEYIMDFT